MIVEGAFTPPVPFGGPFVPSLLAGLASVAGFLLLLRRMLLGRRRRRRVKALRLPRRPTGTEVPSRWSRLPWPERLPGAHVLAGLAAALASIAGAATGLVVSVGFALVGAVAAAAVPLVAHAIFRARSRARLRQGLPDMLDAVAAGLKAGQSLETALANTARSLPPPHGDICRHIVSRLQTGTSLQDALKELDARWSEADIRFLAVTLIIHHESGGPAADALERMAASIRKRQELRKKLRALTAEARMSAGLISIVVLATALAAHAVNREALELMWTRMPGVVVVTTLTAFVGLGLIHLLARRVESH